MHKRKTNFQSNEANIFTMVEQIEMAWIMNEQRILLSFQLPAFFLCKREHGLHPVSNRISLIVT